ncbi:MAG: hypothetical protein WC301_00970 [Candidatus Omnitrophota bacterium]|jgi:hypothetical protein
MKRGTARVILLSVLFCLILYPLYAQEGCPVKGDLAGSHDVNDDGVADVVYYGDGKYITKAEADTNYDGASDVVVYMEEGKFKSAEADTDYDGTHDKKFNDAAEFNSWLNANNPDFNDKLNKDDWRVDILKF